MKKFIAFLLLIVSIGCCAAAMQRGYVPIFLGAAINAVLGAIALTIAILAIGRGMAHCQVCEKPLEDRNRAGDYALKYGVRACGDCGPKLDRRFHDDGPPDTPPIPPFMH